MRYEMRVYPFYWQLIKSGHKTIELRLYDEKRRRFKVGDEIDFLSSDGTGQKIKVEITGFYQAADFAELAKQIDLPLTGFVSA